MYPSISGIEGGGNAICSAYGIGLYPTHIIIAPDGEIIEQDIWPVSSPADFIDPLENNGCIANNCDGGSTLSADFEADMTDPCLGSDVQFTSTSVGEITTYEWTFDGGNPATSDEENPIVTYETSGSYDVSLTVSDGIDENTMTMEAYINVGAIEADFEADVMDICENDMVQFSSTTVCAEELSWSFEGGDPATSDEANPSVTYATPGTYNVSLTAINGDNELEVIQESYITVHNCMGVGSLTLNKMRVSPNPGDGNFQIALPDHGIFEVQVIDLAGQLVYTSNMTATQNQLDVSHLNNGVYIISANNGNTQFRERVVIK